MLLSLGVTGIHLNSYGADVFTNILCNNIRRNVK
jgi:hypothetical protein